VSNALAIAAVTAVIKDLLDNGLIDHKITDAMGLGVTVSAIAPDAIQLGNDTQPRLNLFMHQATPNAAWRNVGQPSRDANGVRLTNPPLALDLHYLLTAYGRADLEAELLLGYAMQLLHETPVLPRQAIRTSLVPPTAPLNGSLLPSVYQALRASTLADQIEQIKITPEQMNTEELSKLWTALQAHYRPTVPFLVTVVLIETAKLARSPLPVLTRGYPDPITKREPGVQVVASMVPPFPEIESVKLPASGQTTAFLGDAIEFDGHDLDGTNHALLLFNRRAAVQQTRTPAASASATAVTFGLPNDPVNYPAGLYGATLRVQRPGDPSTRLTLSNEVALALAPRITAVAKGIDADGNAVVTPTVRPEVRPTQSVSLILGSIELTAKRFDTQTATPSFVVTGVPPGQYWMRLRVDGVDSPLIDKSGPSPVFNAPQVTLP
jgi:Pvc16 N-terminal domain